MKIGKKLCSILMIIILCLGMTGCSVDNEKENQNYKLNIVTSMFPYFDITRAIIGNVEGINLELAVKPGQDSHSFEPTPSEVINMQKADLFIYNGGEIETWVNEVLESYENDNQVRIKMMDAADKIELLCSVGHSHEHSSNNEEVNHSDEYTEKNQDENHLDVHINEDEGHLDIHTNGDEDHLDDGKQGKIQDEHGHEHDEFDAHIWTSPVNAIYITEVICDTLCETMPEEAQKFNDNAENYINQLKEIDEEFKSLVAESSIKELIFADQFPLIYFTTEYGLEYHAAFQGCGHDMEPSVRDICDLIDEIKEKNIKSVFHLELSSERVADTICEDTGAEKLQFNSCHNVSQKQFNDGVTYITLMRKNVENLKKALK